MIKAGDDVGRRRGMTRSCAVREDDALRMQPESKLPVGTLIWSKLNGWPFWPSRVWFTVYHIVYFTSHTYKHL